MSFMSLTTDKKAVTVFERLLTGTDVASETMEISAVTSGVVSLEEDTEEGGSDEEGVETAALCC